MKRIQNPIQDLDYVQIVAKFVIFFSFFFVNIFVRKSQLHQATIGLHASDVGITIDSPKSACKICREPQAQFMKVIVYIINT